MAATYINREKILTSLPGSSATIADAFADKGEESFSVAKVRQLFELNKFLGEKLYIRTKNFGDWLLETGKKSLKMRAK